MKKAWIKKLAAVLIFLASIFIADQIMNRENAEMTREMPKAAFPVVSVVSDGYKINRMYGYKSKREELYLKNNITPIKNNREIMISIKEYDQPVEKIAYEVRSIDGERLVEGSDISVVQKTKEDIRFSLQLKDLTREEQEYTFIVILTMKNGEKIYYYTRFIEKENYYLKEKLDYILSFHETTFSDSEGDEIKKYLESNSSQSNTDFHKVTINSSLKQVMWDQLPIKKITEPAIEIKEIDESTAMVLLNYMVAINNRPQEEYGFVQEYYRVRYTPNRMYLLNYERTLDQIFWPSKESLGNDKITLGIGSEEVQMMESEGGTNLAFVNEKRLFSYGSNDNKFTEIFSFYQKEDMDERTLNRNFDIKILNIEDSGSITFGVYGYMNRGQHEGEVGLAVYYFDYTANTTEELIFIPYEKSEQILRNEINNLLYMNMENHLFFILEGQLYDVNVSEKSYTVVIEGLRKGGYTISTSGRMICWPAMGEVDSASMLRWMNLSNGSVMELKAGYDEYIKVLGFMEEDLIYGLAKKTEIRKEVKGNLLYPMYKVIIKNTEGKNLKEYKKEGIYVTNCRISANQITLERIQMEEDNNYHQIIGDQIASNDIEKGNVNIISTINQEIYKKMVQIVLKNTINPATLKIMNPKEVIYEGERQLALEIGKESRFYVYGPKGLDMVSHFSSEAVLRALELSGTVIDEEGAYIWKKGTKYTKNQIMAVTPKKADQETSPLALCLDTMLSLEGISKKTQVELDKGEDAKAVLEKNLREHKIIDLWDGSLDSVYYYIDQDIPVLGIISEKEAYLIVGFNEQNVVLMDPMKGTVEKKGKNDSAEMFKNAGNQFITYIRKK
ncbi:MAG: hypothetical protein IKL51_06225 [Lachnospiraceae bacterium]|nr:hypothetical protein [Lachnospiraceae bacterium]